MPMCQTLFCHFSLSLCQWHSWIRTLNIGMKRRLFYHCATAARHVKLYFYITLFYKPQQVKIGHWYLILETFWKNYQDSICVEIYHLQKINLKSHNHFPGSNVFKLYFAIFLYPCANGIAGFEPLTLGWWGDCSTTVLLLLVML